MILWRKRRQQQQVALQAAVEQADAEVEKSKERLAQMRAHVVLPLEQRGHRNQFADIIRASLHERKA